MNTLVMLHFFSPLNQLSTILLWGGNGPLLVLAEQSNTSVLVLQPGIAFLSYFWKQSCGCGIMLSFYLFIYLNLRFCLANDLYVDLEGKAHHWELAG